MNTLKKIARTLARSQKGFTLIELLAVMAIVATLAGIVSTSVSGTGETSNSTAAQQDATTVNSAAADFFADQGGAAVITAHSVNVMASLPTTGSGSILFYDVPPVDPASDANPIQQKINSRWPGKFITDGPTPPAGSAITGSSAYKCEFPTDAVFGNGNSGDVVRVSITGKADDDDNRSVITRSEFLEEYIAIDFDKLVDGVVDSRDFFIDFTQLVTAGLLQNVPQSASPDNGGGSDTGSYSWFVKETGQVESLFFHFPENDLNFETDEPTTKSLLDFRGFQEGVYP